jgi:hypothetical protein
MVGQAEGKRNDDADEFWAVENLDGDKQKTRPRVSIHQEAGLRREAGHSAALRVDNKESASISQLAGAWRDALFGAAAVREQALGAMNIAPENRDTQEFGAAGACRGWRREAGRVAHTRFD